MSSVFGLNKTSPGAARGAGWWGILVPLAILGVLFVVVARSPAGIPVAPTSAPPTVFVPTFERLPPVPGGHYELWAQRPDSGEERLAAFTVGPGGSLFTLNAEPAHEFPVVELPPPGSLLLLTVEPGSALVPLRSPRVLLRGSLSTTEVRFEAALPKLSGKQSAMLLAPTDAAAPDTTGVWFAQRTGKKGRPSPGITLLPAPGGWAYGGFVRTAAGTSLPTGLFTDPAKPDAAAPFNGSARALGFPGEDFVRHAPEGVKFPLNLADGRTTVTVSLEPDFATGSQAPYLPLFSVRVPFRQEPGASFALEAVSAETFPRGAGSFKEQLP